MPPIQVVELNLDKIPLVLVVVVQQIVKHGNFAMIGETQIADDAFLALLHQVVEDAVVDIALPEQFHGLLAGAAANGVQQHVVDVIDLELFEGVLEHLDAGGTGLGRRIEVGELGGDEKFFTFVTAQGDARGALAQAAAVGR